MNTPSGQQIAMKLRKSLRLLVAATVILYVALLSLGYYIYNVARSNSEGLCALRADAQTRVEQNRQFLKKHPNGIPGISGKELKRSANNSIRTVRALKNITCPTPPKLPSGKIPSRFISP